MERESETSWERERENRSGEQEGGEKHFRSISYSLAPVNSLPIMKAGYLPLQLVSRFAIRGYYYYNFIADPAHFFS